MDIGIKFTNLEMFENKIVNKKDDALHIIHELRNSNSKMTGWVDYPCEQRDDEINHILEVADYVRKNAELMVVIGVGGSYIGAKAAIEALAVDPNDNCVDVEFAGINLCTNYHKRILNKIKAQEPIICVISKSGNTLEVQVAFHIIKNALLDKYDDLEEVNRRIITITDKKDGDLRKHTEENGYISFEIPDNIGGRYSIMTPVGLFPMAVAGIDIKDFLRGGKTASKSKLWGNTASNYAIVRSLLEEDDGINVEIIETFDTKFKYTEEWIKQLYGESEGKNGRGLFPTSMNFSTDLHSLGQFLQDGKQIFFETILFSEKIDEGIQFNMPNMNCDSLGSLNEIARISAIEAHKKRGIPIVGISIPSITPYYYGQLIYFLEMTCAITANLMEVNPFNQPGVEAYKNEIKARIIKGDR